MIDYLKDLITHTHDLGCVNLVKITGSDTETVVEGLADDRTVVIQAKFRDVIPEFKGTFGMPNMSTLKSYVAGEPFVTNGAIITVKSDDVKGPVSMNFKEDNATSRPYTTDYRFMAKEVVEDMLKTVKFKGVDWNIEIEPSAASIMRLKSMATMIGGETTFTMKTEDGDLVFYFGDHSTHAGNFVFASDVVGELNKSWHWPIAHVISILSLDGDKVFRVSDAGASQIIVDSGLAEYTYILPAQSK